MLNLILETTTGLLKPAGMVPRLPRGPVQATLQLVTNDVAALLPDGQPLALTIHDPANTATILATFNAWTALPAFNLYKGTLNLLTTELGWFFQEFALGRISYGAPNVDTPFFAIGLGGAGIATAPVPQVIINQLTGAGTLVQPLGQFGGKAILNQVEGYWKVKVAGNLLGLQVNAQDAPTGANLLVEVIKNGAATGKVATLAAASKVQETIFGAPLALAVGDIVQFKPTQIGSGKPGTNLSVGGIFQIAP